MSVCGHAARIWGESRKGGVSWDLQIYLNICKKYSLAISEFYASKYRRENQVSKYCFYYMTCKNTN